MNTHTHRCDDFDLFLAQQRTRLHNAWAPHLRRIHEAHQEFAPQPCEGFALERRGVTFGGLARRARRDED